ncbi:hypothetical protein EV360DRAFT_75034 [Lentinula raphanica]|nr:hypothetical protein EV360DRAFT_75034 [Lentinula raphanica]
MAAIAKRSDWKKLRAQDALYTFKQEYGLEAVPYPRESNGLLKLPSQVWVALTDGDVILRCFHRQRVLVKPRTGNMNGPIFVKCPLSGFLQQLSIEAVYARLLLLELPQDHILLSPPSSPIPHFTPSFSDDLYYAPYFYNYVPPLHRNCTNRELIDWVKMLSDAVVDEYGQLEYDANVLSPWLRALLVQNGQTQACSTPGRRYPSDREEDAVKGVGRSWVGRKSTGGEDDNECRSPIFGWFHGFFASIAFYVRLVPVQVVRETLFPGVIEDLRAVERVWCIDGLDIDDTPEDDKLKLNTPIDILDILQMTTRAIRSTRNYLLAQPLPDDTSATGANNFLTAREHFRSNRLGPQPMAQRSTSGSGSGLVVVVVVGDTTPLKVLGVLRELEEKTRLPLSDEAYDAQSDGGGSRKGAGAGTRGDNDKDEDTSDVNASDAVDVPVHQVDHSTSVAFSLIQVNGWYERSSGTADEDWDEGEEEDGGGGLALDLDQRTEDSAAVVVHRKLENRRSHTKDSRYLDDDEDHDFNSVYEARKKGNGEGRCAYPLCDGRVQKQGPLSNGKDEAHMEGARAYALSQASIFHALASRFAELWAGDGAQEGGEQVEEYDGASEDEEEEEVEVLGLDEEVDIPDGI